jgi:hypothetical protein
MNMRMRVCYLDCHEAGLCCYLVIHVENLLHPLRLFHFHLRPKQGLTVGLCIGDAVFTVRWELNVRLL